MPFTILFLILLLILLISFLGGCLWLIKQAFYPRKFTYEKSYLLEVEHGRLNETEFESWEKQEIRLQSPFGYELSGTYFPIQGSQKTVIMLHGFSYTRLGMVKYMPIFRSRNWNILLYDQRFYGRSGGSNTTFGYFEKHDLKIAVDWALTRLDSSGTIATLGESLGAATILQHASMDPRPAFIVADSSFSNLPDELAYRLKTDYNLPAFPLLPISILLIRLLAGFNPSDISPEKDVSNLRMPVLFVHGLADREVPPTHSRVLYAAKQQGLRRLLLVENAGHVESVWTDRTSYDQAVGEFLLESGF